MIALLEAKAASLWQALPWLSSPERRGLQHRWRFVGAAEKLERTLARQTLHDPRRVRMAVRNAERAEARLGLFFPTLIRHLNEIADRWRFDGKMPRLRPLNT
jgi:hypothetical protein